MISISSIRPIYTHSGPKEGNLSWNQSHIEKNWDLGPLRTTPSHLSAIVKQSRSCLVCSNDILDELFIIILHLIYTQVLYPFVRWRSKSTGNMIPQKVDKSV